MKIITIRAKYSMCQHRIRAQTTAARKQSGGVL